MIKDSITGTLEQVLSALQELKSANTTSSQIQSSMCVPSAPIRNRSNVNTYSQRSVYGLGESESKVQKWQVNDTQSNSNVDW